MTRLQYSSFKGFKLGLLIADSYALQVVNVNSPLASAGLHAIKNLVNTDSLQNELGVWGINGNVYTTGGY